MFIPWQDFFRPDPQSSNRSLKKYLQGEGIDLGHRDVVLLRTVASTGIFFSYAVLEAWAEGEISAERLDRLLAQRDCFSALEKAAADSELSVLTPDEATLLIGVAGELNVRSSQESEAQALVVSSDNDSDFSSPMLTVYGGKSMSSQPGAGGVWDEDQLQAESVTLLDGESSQELIEAFRHLFRAAPNGQARASVVASALSRHRVELDLEVAEKLEDIAPAFGKALGQLFSPHSEEGARALKFLLTQEEREDAPAWTPFWRSIRATILQSLGRSERGGSILIDCLDDLARVSSGRELISHQLLDALLHRMEELSPSQQEKLIRLIVDWATDSSAAADLLRSRFNLTGDRNQRLLLGEALRQTLVVLGRDEELTELARFFVLEAISAGSTASSIVLTDLLRSFGKRVFEDTAVVGQLQDLTERQLLNVVGIWELMASEGEEFVIQVGELYIRALQAQEDHLSLFLKSKLLEMDEIYGIFQRWLANSDALQVGRVVAAGFTWSLSVSNRERVSRALSTVDWNLDEQWVGEWRRPQLSFQRLGWLAECGRSKPLTFDERVSERLTELLDAPPTQLYFWHLLTQCVMHSHFPVVLKESVLKSARATFFTLESTQEEEREALFMTGATTIAHHPQSAEILADWGAQIREGEADYVWWLAGVARQLFQSELAPQPPRTFVSALIRRLLASGEKSMPDLLSHALHAAEHDMTSPQTFFPLQISNLCYEALQVMAFQSSCPADLRAGILRRLALFLLSWAEELKVTDDPYSFRETPLFSLLEMSLEEENPTFQALLGEISGKFLELHRQVPEKLRLEVRHTAQKYFREWSKRHPESDEADSWNRLLEQLDQTQQRS